MRETSQFQGVVMDVRTEGFVERVAASHRDMALVPGGTFRMGSDRHYPEEAPAHRVTVDRFWIDPTPVTNCQFKEFVRATGYVTTAEIPPDPKQYPGALPHMLYAGSLVFSPPAGAVDLRDWSQWWQFMKGADWRHPYGPKSNINACLRRRAADRLSFPGWRDAGLYQFEGL